MKPSYYERHSGRDRWMISYLDVLTILLILFVALAAHLQSAPKKPVAEVAPAVAPPPVPSAPHLGTAPASIEQDLEQDGLDVKEDSRGIVVSLSQALLFAPGDDRINNDALPTVDAIGEVLRKIPNSVSLIGHADSVPIHNQRFHDNWELAAARGLRLLDLLTRRCGIDESRLSVESDGANEPRGSNDTPDGRALNRRVEIVIRENPPRANP